MTESCTGFALKGWFSNSQSGMEYMLTERGSRDRERKIVQWASNERDVPALWLERNREKRERERERAERTSFGSR